MPRILWVHAAPDPVNSGELRRLGVPALAVEVGNLECELVGASRIEAAGRCDLAVMPLQALNALPGLTGAAEARILVEVDTHTAASRPEAASVLSGMANRIAGVVARGARAAAWASNCIGTAAPVWLIADPAARKVELAAAALRFGLTPAERPLLDLRDPFELWFCEPGDHLEADEIRLLAAAWAEEAPGRLAIAPPFVRGWLAQAGVRAPSLEWSPSMLDLAFQSAERCVFFGQTRYGQARRRVLALRSGAMAIPPSSPAASQFDPANVEARFQQILEAALVPTRSVHRVATPRSRVLLLLDLIQDLDPILPILDELLARKDVEVRLAVTTWLKQRSPRVLAEIAARNLNIETLDRNAVVQGAEPAIDGVDAVVAVADSSLSAHARVHSLFRRARAAGLPTFALQHGVENVGLHHVAGEDDATVSADYIFVWFPRRQTPASAPAPLTPRLVHVGRARVPPAALANLRGAFAPFDQIVPVFENLHWSRYDEDWRRQFLGDCAEFAFADPTRVVILKPHHGGLWAVKNRYLIPQWPSNLIVADPTDPFWEPYTAASLVEIADAVITTPSTVALDAVQAGKPVAVAAYGLDLPAYAPLPLLLRLSDWFTFLEQAGSTEDARRRALFLARTAQGDEPARRIVDYVLATARGRRHLLQAQTANRVLS